MKQLLAALLIISLPYNAFSQQRGTLDEYNLDPANYDPAIDPDGAMFMKNWQESSQRTIFGALSEWDILTPSDGDSERPIVQGAVLTVLKRFTFGQLEQGKTTTPAKLKNEQKIFYFVSGEGTLAGGKNSTPVRDGIGVIVPPDIEFTIESTGENPLGMYIMTENIPGDFEPKKEIVVRDEKESVFGSPTGHWAHCYKGLFGAEDGLATLYGMGPVWYMPGTIGQPHTHGDPVEEIWIALRGKSTVLIGKQFFYLPPGTAYKIPPTGFTGHSNMNPGDEPIKMFWLMRAGAQEKTGFKYGQLEAKAYDPETESRIDMFISGQREHMQFATHGRLLERDILTHNDGDPVHPTDRGSVLKYLDRFTFATLLETDSTTPTTLSDTQELFYILKGNGTVYGGGKTYDIYPGVTFMIPKGLEFVMKNESGDPMTMYLVAEKVDDSFKAAEEIVWRDENVEPFHANVRWAHNNKWLVRQDEGLSRIKYFLTVTYMPDTFAQPHSHGQGTEEIMAPIDGTLEFMLGKQLRKMDIGEAYLTPADGKTPHANFNTGDKPVKALYIGLFDQE
ncbi:cupin domain-containing protein [Candidatus Latescibacterota bacterium]